MRYFFLSETKPNSGLFARTGEAHDGDADAAARRCAELTVAENRRYGLEIVEPMRLPVAPAVSAEASESPHEPAA